MVEFTSKPCMRRISSRNTMMFSRLLTWKILLFPLFAEASSCMSRCYQFLLDCACIGLRSTRHADHGHQHVFFAVNQGRRIEGGEFKAVSVSDSVGGAGFDTVAAKDAAVVVDVVDLGIAFGTGDSLLSGVLGRLDVDAVGWASCRAKKAGDTFFQAVFVPLQHMGSTKTVLKVGTAVGARTIGIVFHLGGLQHLAERDAHSLRHSSYVSHNGHDMSIRWVPAGPHRKSFPRQFCLSHPSRKARRMGRKPRERTAVF